MAMECMDELKSCPMLAKTCKGVTNSAPCLALCDLCHESCGLCEGPSVTHQPPVTVPPTMAMTTLDEHGFSAEQLKQKQKAISFNAFPCEKDQQLYIQTGVGHNPKCDENGDYYPVQCETKEYSSGGQTYEACWCADHLDGSKILGSTEYMTPASADEQKMKMERKCAPSYGYQRYRENLKRTQDYGYQQESRVASVTPPCRKSYDEIEKANNIATAQTTVYNRPVKQVTQQSKIFPSVTTVDFTPHYNAPTSRANVGVSIAMASKFPAHESPCSPNSAHVQSAKLVRLRQHLLQLLKLVLVLTRSMFPVEPN